MHSPTHTNSFGGVRSGSGVRVDEKQIRQALEELGVCDRLYTEIRHRITQPSNLPPASLDGRTRSNESAQQEDGQLASLARWRNKDRIKTLAAALILCLNIGVDPPDVIKVSPCARMECWINPDPSQQNRNTAAIAKTLQLQYESWQSRAKYRYHPDPTTEDVKKICRECRRHARQERVLFHYNGHGVPHPTANGEIWLFNKNFTQYIPVPIRDVSTWVGSPAIYVLDCSHAGVIINSLKTTDWQQGGAHAAFGQRNVHVPGGAQQARPHLLGAQLPPIAGAPAETIVLAACGAEQVLPQDSDLCADIFTACLTTPIKVAMRWCATRTSLVKDKNLKDQCNNIPGRRTDRKTLLGELNWIFTSITDTIAWNMLPRDLFQKLFRQDLLLASLFRNFMLAERIMKCCGCQPVSLPRLPAMHQHPLWEAWDITAERALQQLPVVMVDETKFVSTSFFSEQLTAFELWLTHSSCSGAESQPQQLPIVLQVLLSQAHRMRALKLLGQFLDKGPWCVELALSVGIFPYVLKLLQATLPSLRRHMVFIWCKILATDKASQEEIVKDNGHLYFIKVLKADAGESDDNMVPLATHTQAVFVLTMLCDGYPTGQQRCLEAGLLQVLMAHLDEQFRVVQTAAVDQSLPDWKATFAENIRLLKWCLLALGKLYDDQPGIVHVAVHEFHVYALLKDIVSDSWDAEVRAAAVFALGCLINTGLQRGGPPPPEEGTQQYALMVERERSILSHIQELSRDAAMTIRVECCVAVSRATCMPVLGRPKVHHGHFVSACEERKTQVLEGYEVFQRGQLEDMQHGVQRNSTGPYQARKDIRHHMQTISRMRGTHSDGQAALTGEQGAGGAHVRRPSHLHPPADDVPLRGGSVDESSLTRHHILGSAGDNSASWPEFPHSRRPVANVPDVDAAAAHGPPAPSHSLGNGAMARPPLPTSSNQAPEASVSGGSARVTTAPADGGAHLSAPRADSASHAAPGFGGALVGSRHATLAAGPPSGTTPQGGSGHRRPHTSPASPDPQSCADGNGVPATSSAAMPVHPNPNQPLNTRGGSAAEQVPPATAGARVSSLHSSESDLTPTADGHTAGADAGAPVAPVYASCEPLGVYQLLVQTVELLATDPAPIVACYGNMALASTGHEIQQLAPALSLGRSGASSETGSSVTLGAPQAAGALTTHTALGGQAGLHSAASMPVRSGLPTNVSSDSTSSSAPRTSGVNWMWSTLVQRFTPGAGGTIEQGGVMGPPRMPGSPTAACSPTGPGAVSPRPPGNQTVSPCIITPLGGAQLSTPRLEQDPSAAGGPSGPRAAAGPGAASSPQSYPASQAGSQDHKSPPVRLPPSMVFKVLSDSFSRPLLAKPGLGLTCAWQPRPRREPFTVQRIESPAEQRFKAANLLKSKLEACQEAIRPRLENNVQILKTSMRGTSAIVIHPVGNVVSAVDNAGLVYALDMRPERDPAASRLNCFHVSSGQTFEPAPRAILPGPSCSVVAAEVLSGLDFPMLMACASDGAVRIWAKHMQPGEQKLVAAWQSVDVNQHTFETPTAAAFHYSPGNQCLHAVGGYRPNVINTWDLHCERCTFQAAQDVSRVPGHMPTCFLTGTDAFADGTVLLSGTCDGVVRLFDLRTSNAQHEAQLMFQNDFGGAPMIGFAFRPSMTLAAAGTTVVHFIDIRVAGGQSTSPRFTLRREECGSRNAKLTSICAHPNAPIFATGSSLQVVKIWSESGDISSTIRLQQAPKPRIGRTMCMAFAPFDLKLATGASDSVCSIYSMSSDSRAREDDSSSIAARSARASGATA